MTKMKPEHNKQAKARGHDADVAAIVDAVLADPTRAEDAKALLTSKLDAPSVVRVAVPKTTPNPKRVAQDADDDMWDNVPV
ncbi:MAG: hypothetical protein HKP37_01145 [Boseongicola sp.]|nr:hypothetical protein [Boseongicola sp.]NNL17323.1 hypothetical protein [Boseongicola sp.]